MALVTGGGGGIGGAVTASLSEAGATVFCADLTAPSLPADIAVEHAQVHCVALDVTRRDRVRELMAQVLAEAGHLDILVNVAGVQSTGPAETLSEEEWNRVIDINLKGTFLCCQVAMGPMRERGFGRIVNLGSVVGKNSGNARPWLDPSESMNAANVAYGVSKSGVHTLTGFLAKELAGSGVTVNAVAPGPIATAMTGSFPHSLRALIPVGRMGTLGDVASAVLFLASSSSGFITGEVLDVNGGMWCD